LPDISAQTHAPVHVSVVVPTYKEVENIPHLVKRISKVRAQQGWDLELLIMDDDSRDGSAELVQRLGLPWVSLITRTEDRGLSQAVLDGLRRANGDVLVVMDADLSHPPEVLPQMVERLQRGHDFVLGSRFVTGGTTDDDWGLFRWLNSRVATLLAWPLTSLKDPMSGFFMMRRATFEGGKEFSPVGYKIGLELYVKCGCTNPFEVPIHFTDRQLGESKLTFKEQLRYLQHVRRLYVYRFALWSELVQFVLVGATGLGVNLALLTLFLMLGMSMRVSVSLAIALSMVWNFVFNRRFSFAYAQDGAIVRQFLRFVSACSLGALVNYAVTLFAVGMVGVPQLAAVLGVVAATGFNFVASRLYVFKQRFVVPRRADLPRSSWTDDAMLPKRSEDPQGSAPGPSDGR
jgi:dolichol-phosphate mannosyltransferase